MRGLLTNERGLTIITLLIVCLPLVLGGVVAVTMDLDRTVLHRQELQRAADAAVLAVAPDARVTREVDARGRVWSGQLWFDPVQARNTALNAFWLNMATTRAQKLLYSIQVDAYVPPEAPDQIVVTVQAKTRLPFAKFAGYPEQNFTVMARAKAVPKP